MKSWGESFRAFSSPPVIRMLFLGFAAGVPILLVFSTLSIWLREAEITRATIGFFSWAGLSYGFKYVWAPVVDRLPVPVLSARLGRRRSWLLIAQLAIIAALVLMGLNDPVADLALTAVFTVMLGFSSATQDVVIDAYRIESADKSLQGLLSGTYIAGYRLGMIVAGAGALMIAGWLDPDENSYQYAPWMWTYLCMAGVMVIGVATTFAIPEPAAAVERQNEWSTTQYLRFLLVFLLAVAAFIAAFSITADWADTTKSFFRKDLGFPRALTGFLVETVRLAIALTGAGLAGWGLVRANVASRDMIRDTYVAPVMDFFDRYGRLALLILALIALYRIADIVLGVMANVFYKDMGYTKAVIGSHSKFFGVIITIVGGLAGGLLTYRYGIIRTLFVGALLAAATNLLFALLAATGAMAPIAFFGVDIQPMLAAVITADNLAGGIASAAFVAYLSSLTSVRFTATQYALFSSMMLLFPKIIAGYSGMAVDGVGYPWFFTGTAILGIPVLYLIVVAGRMMPPETSGK